MSERRPDAPHPTAPVKGGCLERAREAGLEVAGAVALMMQHLEKTGRGLFEHEISKCLGVQERRFAGLRESLLPFFLVSGGMWFSEEVNERLTSKNKVSTVRSSNAAAGWEKRKTPEPVAPVVEKAPAVSPVEPVVPPVALAPAAKKALPPPPIESAAPVAPKPAASEAEEIPTPLPVAPKPPHPLVAPAKPKAPPQEKKAAPPQEVIDEAFPPPGSPPPKRLPTRPQPLTPAAGAPARATVPFKASVVPTGKGEQGKFQFVAAVPTGPTRVFDDHPAFNGPVEAESDAQRLFRDGVIILMGKGHMVEKSARTLMAKFVGLYGEDAMRLALRSAQKKCPGDPKSWVRSEAARFKTLIDEKVIDKEGVRFVAPARRSWERPSGTPAPADLRVEAVPNANVETKPKETAMTPSEAARRGKVEEIRRKEAEKKASLQGKALAGGTAPGESAHRRTA